MGIWGHINTVDSVWGEISHRLIFKSFIPFLQSSKTDKPWNSLRGTLANSMLSMQGAWVPFPVRELDFPCHN